MSSLPLIMERQTLQVLASKSGINVSITGIGTSLSLELNDGVQIFDGSNWSHSTAINAADMESKLYADPSRARRMYITVKKGNKNKVDNEEKEGIVVSMVEDIILAE